MVVEVEAEIGVVVAGFLETLKVVGVHAGLVVGALVGVAAFLPAGGHFPEVVD